MKASKPNDTLYIFLQCQQYLKQCVFDTLSWEHIIIKYKNKTGSNTIESKINLCSLFISCILSWSFLRSISLFLQTLFMHCEFLDGFLATCFMILWHFGLFCKKSLLHKTSKNSCRVNEAEKILLDFKRHNLKRSKHDNLLTIRPQISCKGNSFHVKRLFIVDNNPFSPDNTFLVYRYNASVAF